MSFGFDHVLFELILSLTGNSVVDWLMVFSAEYLVLLIPACLMYIWFQGRMGKVDSMFTAYSTFVGILVSYLMGLLYFHENPSAVYDTIVAFHPENSFPSQHSTALFAAAFPLLYKERKRVGWFLLGGAVLTGFARVYIGEHWPVDILGAVIAGAIGLGIAHFSWGRLEPVWKPLIEFYERVERKIRSRVF